MELDWEDVNYPIFELPRQLRRTEWVSLGLAFKIKPGGGREGEGAERTNSWK